MKNEFTFTHFLLFSLLVLATHLLSVHVSMCVRVCRKKAGLLEVALIFLVFSTSVINGDEVAIGGPDMIRLIGCLLGVQ